MTDTEKLIVEIHKTVGIIQNDMKHLSKNVDAHDKDIIKLVAAHNEVIGKKTLLTTFFGIVGGSVVALIHYFTK